MSAAGETATLCRALAARRGELRNVTVVVSTARTDFGWFDPGWRDSFAVEVTFATPPVRAKINQGLIEYRFEPAGTCYWKTIDERAEEYPRLDVYFTEVTPPNEKGFCNFGMHCWDKAANIRRSRIAIAQVNKYLPWIYGDNYIHVSEIDYFVQVDDPLFERPPLETEPAAKAIAEHVSALVRDGDTIQIGAGSASEATVGFGAFSGKHDLGLHSERCSRGMLNLVRDGIITGKRKNFYPGKAVAGSFASSVEEVTYAAHNPLFHAAPIEWVNDPRTIASNDNMAAINSALSVDLTGQITAEAIDHRVYSGPGGQTCFAIGALLSRGGRFIIVLPSTTSDKKLSRIVPMFNPGTSVTVPRNFADYVVTEHGVARLMGKTLRQRVGELIAIAHPDFRSELRAAARKLWGIG